MTSDENYDKAVALGFVIRDAIRFRLARIWKQ
jgi:hypothetical protein